MSLSNLHFTDDEGGVLLLGEVDSSLQLGSTKWAKIIDTTYYTINTTKMEVFSRTWVQVYYDDR